MAEHYDVVIVGTSFASSFFLLRYLEHAAPNARILVLERGNEDTKVWQLTKRRHSSIDAEDVF
jgi:choline dehydrogenase-like flavoprotein